MSEDVPHTKRSQRWMSVDAFGRTIAVSAGSIVVLTIALLKGAAVQLQDSVDAAHPDRLAVVNRTLADYGVPFNHLTGVREIGGVEAASFSQVVSGDFSGSRMEAIAVGDSYFAVFPEIAVDPDELAVFNKTAEAMLAGTGVAATHSWEVGDRIHIIGVSPRPLELVGFVGNAQPSFAQRVFVHHALAGSHRDRLLGNRTTIPRRVRVAKLHVLVAQDYDPLDVAKRVDTAFTDTNVPTLTRTERQAATTSVSHRVGGLGLFADTVSLCLLSLLLLGFGATVLASTDSRMRRCDSLPPRVRTRIAAKSLVEALCLSLASVSIGLAAVHPTWPTLSRQLDLAVPLSFPLLWSVGVATALLLAMAVSVIPMLRATRTRAPSGQTEA